MQCSFFFLTSSIHTYNKYATLIIMLMDNRYNNVILRTNAMYLTNNDALSMINCGMVLFIAQTSQVLPLEGP